jgi:hypothetical protein
MYSTPFLKRMAVTRAVAHPSDDMVKVSKQVLNMTQRNGWLEPEPHPTESTGPTRAHVWVYRPGDCVTAAVVLRLWNAGFQDSAVFDAAVLRLNRWYLTDEQPERKPGDPEPIGPVDPARPYSPACFILQDFCETGRGWTLRVDHRRHALTGEFRTVASLWRGSGDSTQALGNGAPVLPGESPQSGHIVVLDEILAQIASSVIFKKRGL